MSYPSEYLPPVDDQIKLKRNMIISELKNLDPMLTFFNSNHLKEIYELYDKLSFNYTLSNLLKNNKRVLFFSTTLKSDTTAGLHRYKPRIRTHFISISPKIICNLFIKGETTLKSNGVLVSNRLEALLNIFEHELIHLYCSLHGYTRKIKEGKGKMYYSPHGKLFQELVFRYFGHTGYRHGFNNGEGLHCLDKSHCKVGLRVYFDDKNKNRIYGEIIKVNITRCKINTDTGSIYDVPFGMLKFVNKN
jgi:hypothetical protein